MAGIPVLVLMLMLMSLALKTGCSEPSQSSAEWPRVTPTSISLF
jgi:hypothetical protein